MQVCAWEYRRDEKEVDYINDLIRGLVIDCAPSTNIVVPVRYLEPSLIK